MIAGSCLCGAVKFTVDGAELGEIDACHCTMCRKVSGHYWVSTDVPRAALTITGAEHVQWYRSSEKVQRGFCKTCGAQLFWDPIGRERTGIAMGAIDTATGRKLDIHIFTGDKGDYYEIADDGAKQFRRTPRDG